MISIMGTALSLVAIYIAIASSKSMSRYFRLYPQFSDLRRQEQKILRDTYLASGSNYRVTHEEFETIAQEYTGGDTFTDDTIQKLSSGGWVHSSGRYEYLPKDVGKFLRDQYDERSYTVLIW